MTRITALVSGLLMGVFALTATTLGQGVDTTPPVTSAELNGAVPQDFYDSPVEVALAATDGADEDASGVAYTEYRVDSEDPGDWERADNTPGEDPFETLFTVSELGGHKVEYRSADQAGNVEAASEVRFEIAIVVVDPGLQVAGAPKVRKVGPKQKQVKYRLRAWNRGVAPSGTAQLCATGPANRVRILGPRCVTRSIPNGGMRQRAVKVRIKSNARGKVTKIKLIARGPEFVFTGRTNVRLRVRR